jgi:hypothetical protein
MFNPGTVTAARDWKCDMVVNLAATLILTPSKVQQLRLLLAEIDADESATNPVYALKSKDPDKEYV